MLMKSKPTQLALAATLVVLLGATAAPNMASAQSGLQLAQADYGRKEAQKPAKPRATTKAQRPDTIRTTTTRTKTVVKSDRPRVIGDRDRVVVRSRTTVVPFVVMGPRVVYRSYGAGWCRGLHRGHHTAPGIGWHAGTHVGPVRCG